MVARVSIATTAKVVLGMDAKAHVVKGHGGFPVPVFDRHPNEDEELRHALVGLLEIHGWERECLGRWQVPYGRLNSPFLEGNTA